MCGPNVGAGAAARLDQVPQEWQNRVSLFFHNMECKLIGKGEMGFWFERLSTGERLLVPSAGKHYSNCVQEQPVLQPDPCGLCGWRSDVEG